MMTFTKGYLAVLFLLLTCILPIGSAVHADQLQKETISVGYVRSQIYGVNREDAEAAFKILTLFKAEKVVPFDPGFLSSIVKLKNQTDSFTTSCLGLNGND